MNRRSILLAALGLALGAGVALAAGHIHAERHDDDHYSADHHGWDGDDHWDDDDEDEGGARGPAVTDPNAPTTPTPDNNLFLNGARPKVSVQ